LLKEMDSTSGHDPTFLLIYSPYAWLGDKPKAWPTIADTESDPEPPRDPTPVDNFIKDISNWLGGIVGDAVDGEWFDKHAVAKVTGKQIEKQIIGVINGQLNQYVESKFNPNLPPSISQEPRLKSFCDFSGCNAKMLDTSQTTLIESIIKFG
jgi:hypothetical protein